MLWYSKTSPYNHLRMETTLKYKTIGVSLKYWFYIQMNSGIRPPFGHLTSGLNSTVHQYGNCIVNIPYRPSKDYSCYHQLGIWYWVTYKHNSQKMTAQLSYCRLRIYQFHWGSTMVDLHYSFPHVQQKHSVYAVGKQTTLEKQWSLS